MAERTPDQHVYVEARELSRRMAGTLEEMADGGGGCAFKGPTIYAVPDSLRQGSDDAYEPTLVSIGPLHRSKSKTEHLKWRYLRELLDREPRMRVEAFVDAMWPLQESARTAYSVQVDLGPSEFVELLVLDGCFLLEFLIKRAMGNLGSPWKDTKWNLPTLRKDLLLLENQIPFCVLATFFHVRFPNGLPSPQSPTTTLSIMDLALHYVDKREVSEEKLREGYTREELLKEGRTRVKQHEVIHHLLHLHYLCQLLYFDYGATQAPSPACCWNRFWMTAYERLLSGLYFCLSLILMCRRPRRRSFARSTTPRTIPSATNLREAGVKFKRREGTECYLNVSFSEESGMLAIPHMSLQQSTVSSLRNLIAFEQCCPGIDASRTYITAYATFMDKIIDTPEDVAVLLRHRIVESKLGTDEDVADLFNNICKGASLKYEGHYLVELFKQVNGYCDSDQHRWRAALVDGYFHNPWAAVSIIVAGVLLVLTLGGTVASVVQTVYTVKAYKKG